MDAIAFFTVIFITITLVAGGPTSIKNTPDTTLYDVIIEKCPKLKEIENFKTQPLFKTCKNWTQIQSVNELNDKTKIDLLCLLYYDNFISYCTSSDQLNITLPRTLIELDEICDNLAVIPSLNASGNLKKLVSTKEQCFSLCTDGIGYVEITCGISYHFGKMAKLSKPNPPIKASKSPSSVEQKHNTSTQEELLNSHNSTKRVQVVHSSVDSQPHKKMPEQVSIQNAMKVDIPPKNKTAVETAAVIPIKSPQPIEKPAPVPNPPVIKNASAVEVPVAKPTLTGKGEVKEISEPLRDPEEIEIPPPAIERDNIPIDNPDENNTELEDPPGNADVPQPNEPNEQFRESDEEDDDQPFDVKDEKPKTPEVAKPDKIDESDAVSYTSEMSGDSYFFSYFMLLCIIFIVGYVCYHNKQKILALILEGRRGKRQYRSRRPNSANYHKLDTNLEEAISSSCTKSTSNVIY